MCASPKDTWRIRAYRTYWPEFAHLQTNGRLVRIHGKLQRRPGLFGDVAGPPGSACRISPPRIERYPITGFMKRYNCGRPHMPPDTTIEETPAAAFKRKMPPPETEPAYDRLPPCDNGFLCKAGCWHHLRCIANTSTHRYNRFRPLVRRHMRLQQNRTMKTPPIRKICCAYRQGIPAMIR